MPSRERGYKWSRFWCPPDRQINLSDGGGYLVDPETEWGRYANPYARAFSQISDSRCLVLLGEQGIGKSRTVEAEVGVLGRAFEAGQDHVHLVNLNKVSSEYALDRQLFEHPEVLAWMSGNYCLHLFIDSFDEGIRYIPQLPNIIMDRLSDFERDRMFLRIVCRTGAWPPAFESGLKQVWDSGIGVYELVPLRRIDVKEAASAQGFDPGAFCDEVDRLGAVPLAAKPLTFNLLIAEYGRSGKLSSSQLSLYARGLRALCEEAAERRPLVSLRDVTGGQRLGVAQRIAALTVFASRAALRTVADGGDQEDRSLAMHQVAGGTEEADGSPFDVTEQMVGATLETSGLFTSRGSGYLGWAHDSYAEFLAASYLNDHGISLPQVASLFVHPEDDAGRLVPQLHGTAAWLAAMRQDVLNQVLELDPEALLNSDVQMPESSRAPLVAALLKLHGDGSRDPHRWQDFLRYQRLAHPSLAEQLRPYVADPLLNEHARYVAIDVAEACQLRSLQDDLLSVALDPDQALRIRINAARAVAVVGDEQFKARLSPLVADQLDIDPLRQLKGVALSAVWPNHMSSEELFADLPPSHQGWTGFYELFLSSDLVRHLPVTGLPIALDWCRRQLASGTPDYRMKRAVGDIMIKSLENLDTSGVLDALRGVVFDWLRKSDYYSEYAQQGNLAAVLREDSQRRRSVLAALMTLVEDENDFTELADLVASEDTLWIVEQCRSANGEARLLWVRLLGYALDVNVASDVDAVLSLYQGLSDPQVEEVLAPFVKPVQIDSEDAQRLRKRYQTFQELRRRSDQDEDGATIQHTSQGRIVEHLDSIEGGQLAKWLDLIHAMNRTVRGRITYHKWIPDLTRLPGWDGADEQTKRRIIAAAEMFVRGHQPRTWEVLGTDQYWPLDYAGYQALELLWRTCPERLARLADEAWHDWVAVLLAFPAFGENDQEAQRHILEFSHRVVPESISQAITRLIEAEPDYTQNYIAKVSQCWDDRLGRALLNKAHDGTLPPHQVGHILEALLDHGIPGAQEYAKSLVPSPPPQDEEARTRAHVAARVLLTHASDAGWDVVWPALQQDGPFAERLIVSLESLDRDADDVCARLTDDQVAALYTLLSRQFPHAEDSNILGAHWTTERERIGYWRNALLDHLRNRGTAGGRQAIRQIVENLPHLEWLKRILARADYDVRQKTWRPLEPQHILSLVKDTRFRVVQSADQLLDVVMESLQRLDAWLQRSKPPMAIYLWDERCGDDSGGCRPKDESRLSDFVKAHLDLDLASGHIIINREVENRPGEENDIYVQAAPQSGGDTMNSVTVVIEVKGCWHPDVKTAMEMQLCDRYLRKTHDRRGIYLVGWYNCSRWDRRDYRRRRAPAWNLDEARQTFDFQSKELSDDDIRIKSFILDTSI